MVVIEWTCSRCSKTGTDSKDFKRGKNTGHVLCTDCIALLRLRKELKNVEAVLQEDHAALAAVVADDSATKADFKKAHDRYKAAYAAANDVRHRLNAQEYGFEL